MRTLTCPGCGYDGITAEYDICVYCGWEHDAVREIQAAGRDPSRWGLRRAQRAVAGRLAEQGSKLGQALERAVRDPLWRLLDEYREQDLALLVAATATEERAGTAGRRGSIISALDDGADIESAFQHGYYQGWTPLLWVVSNRALVHLLLERGADPNARGKHEATPLIVALRGADVATARLLVEAGADTELTDAAGVVPAEVVGAEEFREALGRRAPAEAAAIEAELRAVLCAKRI